MCASHSVCRVCVSVCVRVSVSGVCVSVCVCVCVLATLCVCVSVWGVTMCRCMHGGGARCGGGTGYNAVGVERKQADVESHR